jgi:hypothetical protein
VEFNDVEDCEEGVDGRAWVEFKHVWTGKKESGVGLGGQGCGGLG